MTRVVNAPTEEMAADVAGVEIAEPTPEELGAVIVSGVISVACGHEVYAPLRPEAPFVFVQDVEGPIVCLNGGRHGVLQMDRDMAMELAHAIVTVLGKAPEQPMNDDKRAQLEAMGFTELPR